MTRCMSSATSPLEFAQALAIVAEGTSHRRGRQLFQCPHYLHLPYIIEAHTISKLRKLESKYEETRGTHDLAMFRVPLDNSPSTPRGRKEGRKITSKDQPLGLKRTGLSNHTRRVCASVVDHPLRSTKDLGLGGLLLHQLPNPPRAHLSAVLPFTIQDSPGKEDSPGFPDLKGRFSWQWRWS
eukprot:jgi/Botrbrau1/8940/Bobra.0148s0053.1